MGVGLGPMLVAAASGLALSGGTKIGIGVIVLAVVCTPLCSALFFVSGRAMARILRDMALAHPLAQASDRA